jgi:hypothetical protein
MTALTDRATTQTAKPKLTLAVHITIALDLDQGDITTAEHAMCGKFRA